MGDAWDVDAVGTRGAVEPAARERFSHALRLGADAVEDDVGTRVDYQRNAGRAGGDAHRRDSLGLQARVDEPRRIGRTILEIQADGTGRERASGGGDGIGDRFAISALEVGGDRKAYGAANPRDAGQHSGQSDAAAVRKAFEECDAGAGRRHGLEAERLQNPCAGRLPCVDQHQRIAGSVEASQALRLLTLTRHPRAFRRRRGETSRRARAYATAMARLPVLPLVLALALATGLPPARAADAVSSVTVPVLAAAPSMNGTIDDSWAKAATLSLDTDFTYRRPASEPTKVYVAQDGSFLDIAFAVTQSEPQTAAQETNSSSILSEDYVGVYLDPQGTTGISYGFFANPHGARYQTSSENTAYTPQWTAVGKPSAGGYTVTMRIPLDIIRSGGSTSWTAQFVRATVATNGLAVWAYSDRAHTATDPAFAGKLIGVGTQPHASARPKARVGIYGLGELTTQANGGNTSRVGADFSLPITPTASFVGTLHPDYSNVEIDQQTIAPTAFARQYSEVRPFFTQAASYYNQHISCSDCPLTLYTPAIPTFSQGYAVEGTQGRASFAAFDALGDGRDDNAEALNYNYEDPNAIYAVDFQRVGVSTSGLNDVTTTVSTGYLDQKSHFLSYLNAGEDRGTYVTDPAIGNYLEAGVGYVDATTTSVLNYQSIGAQFDPVDGYVAQTDIEGYEFSQYENAQLRTQGSVARRLCELFLRPVQQPPRAARADRFQRASQSRSQESHDGARLCGIERNPRFRRRVSAVRQ